MTHRPDPPVRVLRSLPLAVVAGIAVSVIGALLSRYYIGLRIADAPLPTGQAWVNYLTIRVVAGACVGAGIYAVGWPPKGWLRMCLAWALFLALNGGDVDDFARWSLGYWLEIWLLGSLLSGVFLGTLIYGLQRLKRFQPAP
ncbi:hypothetical protein [Longimicrobium sp.]|uniref:hypothetical protein n=1 Tax=Longimicrobium sp. TaxID=2029185 RepID=UPI003B3B7954